MAIQFLLSADRSSTSEKNVGLVNLLPKKELKTALNETQNYK